MEDQDNYKNIQRGCGSITYSCLDCNNDSYAICNETDSCNKLNIHDWLDDIPQTQNSDCDICEVRFKNTRKGFYRNINNLDLEVGDFVAVEASPGHDIGVVSVKGPLVKFQMKKARLRPDIELKKIYRKAKEGDIEKWKQVIAREDEVMLKSRQIAESLQLDMKIGDVEFQGDGTKAIFYYIADERVDFRELIKIMADEFKIRIEMKQIGARQEAGRIGGIGPCGRELCCTTWITNFVSVSTNNARQQELSLNPQKLAGQCGKLKCCLNYEIDAYIDAQKDFPSIRQPLETMEGIAYHQKTDIFKRVMWFSYDQNSSANITVVPIERVKEIIQMNKRGEKPDTLLLNDRNNEQNQPIVKKASDEFVDASDTEDISRFDSLRKKKKKKNKNKNKNQNQIQDTEFQADNSNDNKIEETQKELIAENDFSEEKVIEEKVIEEKVIEKNKIEEEPQEEKTIVEKTQPIINQNQGGEPNLPSEEPLNQNISENNIQNKLTKRFNIKFKNNNNNPTNQNNINNNQNNNQNRNNFNRHNFRRFNTQRNRNGENSNNNENNQTNN
ncbi:MAG: hypothetical protein MJ211_04645 [Bacteroidales bacterium]|nr:hypothetical protein [Bacteroidales bacterium]